MGSAVALTAQVHQSSEDLRLCRLPLDRELGLGRMDYRVRRRRHRERREDLGGWRREK